MKTGIITYHFVNNFGGALQAYALRHYIAEHFCKDTGLIDYRHPFIRFTDTVRMLPVTANTRYYMPWFRSFPRMLLRRRKFNAFMKKEMNLSRKCSTLKQVDRVGSDYGMLICGSDQIWNPTITMGISKPYFLRFGSPDATRISYAASVGKVSEKKRKTMLSYIRDLDQVSIREDADWIENAEGLTVEHHIDPTLLIPTEDWEKIAKRPRTKGKYIVNYFMQKNEEAYTTLGRIKKDKGFRVFDISRYGYRPECVDKSLVSVGPEDFVGLFASAQHVCTNSFHGLVFGLIFGKSIDFIPMKRFGGRIEYLCSLLKLDLVPSEDGAYFHVRYDRDVVKEVLTREREKAAQYFGEAFRKAGEILSDAAESRAEGNK